MDIPSEHRPDRARLTEVVTPGRIPPAPRSLTARRTILVAWVSLGGMSRISSSVEAWTVLDVGGACVRVARHPWVFWAGVPAAVGGRCVAHPAGHAQADRRDASESEC